MINREEKDWYRDAVIYQLHVKSFFDSDNDGVGDFEGVTRKLDYIRDLGATAIWIMPFYPSPLRDDGYDISNYRGINPAYGTLRHFKRLVREAHERDIRVITELVINHTSDQHPWFQRARKAKPGSAMRDFYVWSDTDKRFADARVIFVDTEPSNWTWDPVAHAYYWHRFYSHQPDLNFDNPRVLEAVLDTMRYWLDMGVDGLRLDAVPYLIERDGTSCENLPETHKIIKQIRAAVDADYPDRMLLAEANQWPEETAPYFGKGDECHMAFHFPLMPRMYMSLALEDRHPVTDIMRQTPEIPEGTQWAIFLRNHDELTLEMVSDRERDYLWTFYAADRRARLNLGIRRRLAPLLGNDRRKIELMNSLLCSMPGSPILYYGDEIGMGDNIYLGDRDGVRTPMQWSPDRNGGFSRVDPARLFLPAIQDSLYGFNGVNVEAQLATPASLLNWTRRIVAIRRNHSAFGRGALRFLYPSNRKVLAYLREFKDERLLCVANVSRAPQAVELDLAEFKGAVPVELTGGSEFPQVGTLPYLLTLPGYGFFWFRLDTERAAAERFGPSPVPELFTLVFTRSVDELLAGRELATFERTIAPQFLGVRRWFAGKGAGIAEVKVKDFAQLPAPAGKLYLLVRLAVHLRDGGEQTYFTPLTIEKTSEEDKLLPYTIARARRGPHIHLVYDVDADSHFGTVMVERMVKRSELSTSNNGSIRFFGSHMLPENTPVDGLEARRLDFEQSNSSFLVGESMILKIYRRTHAGTSPEIEMGRFLTDVAHFKNTPPMLGYAEHIEADGTSTPLCVLQSFIRNQGDAWTWALDALRLSLETAAVANSESASAGEDEFASFRPYAIMLGRRTAEMHLALATPTEDPAFSMEPLSSADMRIVADDAKIMLDQAFKALDAASRHITDETTSEAVKNLAGRREECGRLIDSLTRDPVGSVKIRIHGDYHLGQILIAREDVMIVDFEGEPARTLEMRRAKQSPMRDVAGMLRSFAYATEAAVTDVKQRLASGADIVASRAAQWCELASQAFLSTYAETISGSPLEIADPAMRERLLRLYLLTKALYEIGYEANSRPAWIRIPVRGVLALLDKAEIRS